MNISFVDLFREQAQRTPNNTAVEFAGEKMSYHELDACSDRVAYNLHLNGVQPESLVPLFIESGIKMAGGILGIMKAGAAYVPIDINTPQERIKFILEDTGAALILSSSTASIHLKDYSGIKILEPETLVYPPEDYIPLSVLPQQLAYVIYTSGSTGSPKGVMVEHRNIVDYVNGLINAIHINECSTFALVSTFATDLGNTVIFGSLATGGTLHVFDKESLSNIEYLHDYFKKYPIDCLKIVPSHWNALSLEDSLLLPEKLLIFGGETLHGKLIEKIRAVNAQCKIINHYGPTETTIGKLLFVVDQIAANEKSVPVGKPFSNTKVLVLNSNLKLCPIGVPGELYITGDGVARGYLKNPEMTDERFIKNPYAKNGHSLMYKTGDVVKYQPDGNITFIGRADNQVKIRGYRVELGEIESVLQQHSQVDQAVVLAHEDKQGNKKLTGYVIGGASYVQDQVLDYVRDKLPDYMVPSMLHKVEAFPLTANGKIDRKAFPDPDQLEVPEAVYTAPRNETEAALAGLWQDILEVEQVGIHDDFFVLGGHSLLAVRLVSAIRKKVGIQISLNDLFIYPTIFQITNNLPGSAEEKVEEVVSKVKIKYLVPVKAAGKKMPLYIVAGGGGTALRFMKFAELMDPGQPVFVLQPPADPKDLEEFPDTIEDISKKFIEEIMVKNPEGPYALSGHCRGGLIAFEMAKQLKERGKTVNLLAMFDTIIRKANAKPPAGMRNLYYAPQLIRRTVLRMIFKIKFETFLLTKHTKHAVSYKMDALKKSLRDMRAKSNGVTDKMEYAGLEIFNESLDIYANACNNYHLHPLDKEIVLFYAKDHYYFMDAEKKVAFRKYYLNDETKNMWHHYAKSITIHEIEGEHSTMFDRETAGGFAEILQGYLNSSKS